MHIYFNRKPTGLPCDAPDSTSYGSRSYFIVFRGNARGAFTFIYFDCCTLLRVLLPLFYRQAERFVGNIGDPLFSGCVREECKF